MGAPITRSSLVKLGLVFLLFALLGGGCRKQSWHRISNSELEKLLAELYIARGVGQSLYLTSEQQDSLYSSILQTHKLTQEDLDSTIYYLSSSKAKVLLKIIDRSKASVQRELDLLERAAEEGYDIGKIKSEQKDFYMPLSDSISCSVTILSPYPIQINRSKSYYQWQVALSDIPNHPETIWQVEIEGLVCGTVLPAQYQMPMITISKQLNGNPPPLAMQSVTRRLPIGGTFKLSLGEKGATGSEGSIDFPLLFTPTDTVTVSVYCLPTDYLDSQSLYFKLQDLRIVAH